MNDVLIFLVKFLLAVFLGAILGWQRERIGKSAGIRTYALVAAGSTLFTILSTEAFAGADPSRIASQIVVGIGFLGVGTIIHRDSGSVEGLTTAAGMWAVAAIGMTVGVGWFWQATLATMLLLGLLMINDHRFVKPIDLSKNNSEKIIR